MFFGNLLGSVIANSTLVIGTTALIRPIQIVAFDNYLTSIFFFIASFLVFWLFIRSKRRLDRWEAVMLLTLYLSFVLIELFS
jgi:cation:H+ antiporter